MGTTPQDVMAEEKARGRKRGPSDVITDRLHKKLRLEIEKAWEQDNLAGFLEAMRKAKIPAPLISLGLKKWREMRGKQPET